MQSANSGVWKWLCVVGLLALLPSQTMSAVCTSNSSPNQASTATGVGGANANVVDTVCWLDMAGFTNLTNTTAQTLTYNLRDGVTVRLTLQRIGGANLATVAVPAWSGAAFGRGGYSGILGRPVIYYADYSNLATSLRISNISVTRPGGQSVPFRLVVADGESSNSSAAGAETLTFTNNSGSTTGWELLDTVPGASNAATFTASGNTFNIVGGGDSGNVRAFLAHTSDPTSVTLSATSPGAGQQGWAVGIQLGTVRVNKLISPMRASNSDQFTYSASIGGYTNSVSTTGSTVSGFPSAVFPGLNTGDIVTVSEAMASGSANTLSVYQASYRCLNAAGSQVAAGTLSGANGYSFTVNAVAREVVVCNLTNAMLPRINFAKAKQTNGGTTAIAATFAATTNSNLSGTPANITSAAADGVAGTPNAMQQVLALATPVRATEVPAANFTLSSAVCRDSNSALSGNAASFNATISGNTVIIPAENILAGALLTCTLTNSTSSADLSITKTRTPVGDVVVGDQITYTLTVGNSGPASATGTVVTDSINSGLSCPASTPINCTNVAGNGCPVTGLTAGNLMGSGVVLGTFNSGDSLRLTYTCTVQ